MPSFYFRPLCQKFLGTFQMKKSVEDSVSVHTRLLKGKDVKHIRIDDVKTLYEIYEFQEEIGHGAYGIVVSAIEKSASTNVAIKIVNKHSTSSNKLKEIYRELKILKVVTHPNIIDLLKVYETNKKIYMVLEKCRETLLHTYKQKCSLFTEKTSRHVIKQLVGAISYLHKNDIVHRDVKMDNILMSTNPSDPNDQFFIKLGDFGLSVIKTGTGLHGMLRERCGTILYMPPEILRQHSYSELCDVWSIGIIMYALLYGKYPFFSTVEEQLIEMICRSEPEYESVPINRDAVDLIQCALKKEPVNRITAVEMLTHPWLDNNKLRSRKGETIIDYMKKWKNEMLIPGGEENDWMSAVNNADDQHYSILCMKTDSQKPRAVNSFPNCGSYPSTTTASSNMSGQV